ncbi:dihydropteroate synthase [Haloferax profundi]|uniref:dihydropteroate synthase n=1 Tax=Haloferax profundi TaxID=1544718 RepID=A0A0W1SLQ5_9EURY|nr:dihydropteroate synthase [Haloferax profundi]KTG27180.1 dihydropteroate synthase [Haloferax profundi]
MRTVDAAGLEIGDDHPPRIMGVLNVSKESPYKPSVFNDPSEAAEYVDRELIDEGADIVDIGLESANKRLDVLSAEDELDRLDTALSVLDHVSGDAVFSIETRYHEVAEAALANGFDMVNDICGFADPKMPEVCEEFDAAVAKMASPPDLTRPGAIEEVDDIYDALELNGFTDKTIVDPAFGGWSEAKTLEHDRETFHRLREFRGYGYPILVSINRKNFLRDVAGRSTEDALPVSLAATSMAVERGAHVIRTHDVRETRDAALIGHEFKRRRVREPGDVSVEELDVTTPGDAARHLDRIGAPRDVAAESVTRVFELEGLAESDRETLATAAADAGAVFAGGETGALLVGTPTALRRVPDVVGGSSDALEAAVETIAQAVR